MKDAYGEMMWAYYKGARSAEIVERDDGFFTASVIGPKGYFSPYRDWPGHQKKAMRYAMGRVLDIGCGAGRHSLYLQDKGHQVTGIDKSPVAAKISRLRGLKTAKAMAIEDIGQFKPGSFDTILMMGNNFGLFGGFRKARRLLKKMHRITSPGARIIAESLDPYETRNPAHLDYQESNRKKGRMGGQIRIRIRFERLAGDWFDYLLVSRKEMAGILKGTGWEVTKFIESGEAFYIAVIEKSKDK